MRTTVAAAARRIPVFSAAAVPREALVQTTSVSGRPSASSRSACSGEGPSATMHDRMPAGAMRFQAGEGPVDVVRPVLATSTTVAVPVAGSSRRDGTDALEP